MVWRTKVQVRVQDCSFFQFLIFSTIFFYPCCSNFVIMEEMLWIEDIVENTQALPFFTDYKVNNLILSLEEK